VFADKRNDPCVKAISNLSPYFNYGQLSVQAVMLKARARDVT
jgi:deoxyribodipyrimidine photolyase